MNFITSFNYVREFILCTTFFLGVEGGGVRKDLQVLITSIKNNMYMKVVTSVDTSLHF